MTFTVQVRYRTESDGYRYVRYAIHAETAADAKSVALLRAYRIRGSSMHDAEIIVA